MKPTLLKVSSSPEHSFSVRQDTVPYINNKWHYHAEVELIYIVKGSGTLFIGSSIKHFKLGDLILIGANLPHYWRYDDVYFLDQGPPALATVTHFNADFLGDVFLKLPENKMLKNLFERAKRGLRITGKARHTVAALLQSILTGSGTERIIMLLQALNEIAIGTNSTFLSPGSLQPDFAEGEHERINAIYEYSAANFRRKIELSEIASVACISANSFCRYFKSRTNKTYTQFLNEIRIGYACKLLMEGKPHIKEVCYSSGFNNFTSFHKFFKSTIGMSPLVYQRQIA